MKRKALDVSELGIADFLGCRDKVILAPGGIIGAIGHVQRSIGPVAVLVSGPVICLNLVMPCVRELMVDAEEG